jgi:hemoglobin-like flavoprotein
MRGNIRLAAIVTHLNHRLLRQTFDTVKSRADVLAKRFYELLFAQHPRFKRLFGRVDLEEQHQKLIQSLVLIVKWLETPDRLTHYLRALGGRHVEYRVGPEDYEPFIQTFIAVLGETVGAIWTTECEVAWRDALRAVADTMLEGSGVFDFQPYALSLSTEDGHPPSVTYARPRETPKVNEPAPPARTSVKTRGVIVEETIPRTRTAANLPASRNLELVLSSAAQLSASIDEIARCVQDASKITAQANDEADNANTTIRHLGEVGDQISQIVNAIASIAQQTTFLALNATIEANRAGEAGKGIAEGADEIKELARLTAKASEEISHKIEAIQNSSGVAISAIGSIGGTINQINQIALTIAEAIAVQTAVTSNISRQVAEAACGNAEVFDRVAGVYQGAAAVGYGSIEILVAAEGLGQESGPARSGCGVPGANSTVRDFRGHRAPF